MLTTFIIGPFLKSLPMRAIAIAGRALLRLGQRLLLRRMQPFLDESVRSDLNRTLKSWHPVGPVDVCLHWREAVVADVMPPSAVYVRSRTGTVLDEVKLYVQRRSNSKPCASDTITLHDVSSHVQFHRLSGNFPDLSPVRLDDGIGFPACSFQIVVKQWEVDGGQIVEECRSPIFLHGMSSTWSNWLVRWDGKVWDFDLYTSIRRDLYDTIFYGCLGANEVFMIHQGRIPAPLWTRLRHGLARTLVREWPMTALSYATLLCGWASKDVDGDWRLRKRERVRRILHRVLQVSDAPVREYVPAWRREWLACVRKFGMSRRVAVTT